MQYSAALLSFLTISLLPTSSAISLPIVDLGYAIHQATINNSATPYYNFSNIRYGQAPIGSLRFAPPVPPTCRNTTINNGQNTVIPTQATPAWEIITKGFINAYLTGQNISNYENSTYDLALIANASASLSNSSPDPRTSEDCLFLDVVVPTKVFDAAKSCKGAPVLVWIYGGGYTQGDKTSSGSPASLLARSQLNGSEGVIFVAMNYRLGLFGWLSGNKNVTGNVGLLDQRLALEWIQKNIHQFGGDPSRVTVIGESAGGGSIMHHITSYGGKGPAPPFQQAIPQSPAFQIIVPEMSKIIFTEVLGNASLLAGKPITTVDHLRALPYKTLATLNTLIVGKSPYGSFTFGPVIDVSPNSYVPDLPLRLIAQDKFHNVGVMVGHNANEGLLFTPPFIDTQAEEVMEFTDLYPTANSSIISYITNTLYPPIYNGSYGYRDTIGRSSAAISDFTIDCNAHYLAQKLSPGYGYYFAIPPGVHGEDVAYTFFNGDTSTLDSGVPLYPAVATVFQRYLTEFAMTGVPTAEGYQTFVQYGSNNTVTLINYYGLGEHEADPAARPQCQFWAEAPYYTAGSS